MQISFGVRQMFMIEDVYEETLSPVYAKEMFWDTNSFRDRMNLIHPWNINELISLLILRVDE